MVPVSSVASRTQDGKSVWFVGYTPNMAAAAMIAGATNLVTAAPALPAPNEKDATRRAYRPVASFFSSGPGVAMTPGPRVECYCVSVPRVTVADSVLPSRSYTMVAFDPAARARTSTAARTVPRCW